MQVKSLFDLAIASVNDQDLSLACKIIDIRLKVENIIDTNRKLEIFGYAIVNKNNQRYIIIGTPDKYIRYHVSTKNRVKYIKYYSTGLTILNIVKENITIIKRIVNGITYRVVTVDNGSNNELIDELNGSNNRKLLRMSISSDDFCEKIGIFKCGNIITYDYENYAELRFYSLLLCKCGEKIYESEVNDRTPSHHECNWIENSSGYCNNCSRN